MNNETINEEYSSSFTEKTAREKALKTEKKNGGTTTAYAVKEPNTRGYTIVSGKDENAVKKRVAEIASGN